MEEIKISMDEAQSACRLGMGEKCCAFLIWGGPSGWGCAKSIPQIGISISKRLEEGTMVAKGEGNWEGCLWAEREKVKNNGK